MFTLVGLVVALVIGIVVGWHVPQPPWAKWALAKVKGWFRKPEAPA